LQDLSYEVWVVDNHSVDGSAGMVEESFPEVRLITNNENRGFATANNQALAETCGCYIVLLNGDTVLLNGDTYLKQNSFLEIVHYGTVSVF